MNWLSQQNPSDLFLTAITVAEIRRGLGMLPDGRRRQILQAAFESFLTQGFGERILPFSKTTATLYPYVYVARAQAGLGIGELDMLIAAIAKEWNARVATRNTTDFEGCGLLLINPWQ